MEFSNPNSELEQNQDQRKGSESRISPDALNIVQGDTIEPVSASSRMPTEILQMIAESLNWADLLKWRLVSEKFRFCSEKAFQRTHIFERRVMLHSKRSLKKAQLVAKHPKLGHQIKKLWINGGGPSVAHYLHRLLHPNSDRHYMIRCPMYTRLLLAQILASLRGHCQLRELELTDCYNVNHSNTSLELSPYAPKGSQEPPFLCSARQFQLVADACEQAGLSGLESLSITPQRGIIFKPFVANSLGLRNNSAFASLRSLTLRMERLECDNPHGFSGGLAALILLDLEGLTQLETLSIEIVPCSRRASLDSACDTCGKSPEVALDMELFANLMNIYFARLVNLRVERCYIPKKLQDFVRNNSTVRQLDFRDCRLFFGPEDSAYEAIKRTTRLKDVHTDASTEKAYIKNAEKIRYFAASLGPCPKESR